MTVCLKVCRCRCLALNPREKTLSELRFEAMAVGEMGRETINVAATHPLHVPNGTASKPIGWAPTNTEPVSFCHQLLSTVHVDEARIDVYDR